MESSREFAMIGIAIATMLDESVSELRVLAEVHDDWVERRYDIVPDGKLVEGVEGERPVNRSVNDDLSALRRNMLKEGQEDRHDCLYALRADGSSKIDFDRSKPPSA